MTIKISTTKTTTETLNWNASEPSVTTENQLTIQGKAIVEISSSAIYIRDNYGEENRTVVRYWSDHGEAANAVVDYVAKLHDGLSSTSENVRQSSRELLDRILGAAGNA